MPGSFSNFEASIFMKSDYYPFGMQMPGRHIEYTSEKYRFAYNGMEVDNEVKGNGNSYTTEFRQYDPRLGRWLSLDPLIRKYPHMSPYVAFNNNPVFFVDPLGLEGGPAKDDNGVFVNGGKVAEQQDMQVSAKGLSKDVVDGNKESAIKKIGKFSGKEYDSYRQSAGAYDYARKLAQTGQNNDFARQYKENNWSQHDYNVKRESYPGEYQDAVNDANKRKAGNMKYTYIALGTAMTVATGGLAIYAAPVIAPVISQSLSLTGRIVMTGGRYTWQGAKLYHNTFGKHGGYANIGWNYYN